MAIARLIFKSGVSPGTELPLNPGLNRVGRSPDNDVVVADASVSTHHCEISVSGIAVAVRDLGSTNGTFINQQKVLKGILQRGDILTLGGVDFGVETPEAHISIPEQEKVEIAGAAFLENGAPACYNHRTIPATLSCPKCEIWYCDACVREVKRLTNNPSLRFCPECSCACEPLPLYSPAGQRKTFLGKLQETLRLTRKK